MPDNVFAAAPPDTATAIALLDRLRPGDWLAFASDGFPLPDGIPTLRVDASLERAAGAVLPLLPISRHTLDPLLLWSAVEADPAILDLLFAMQGLASDASGRRMTAATIGDATLMHGAVDAVDAVIRLPWQGTPFLFLVCVGGGIHAPTDLTTRRPVLAEVC